MKRVRVMPVLRTLRERRENGRAGQGRQNESGACAHAPLFTDESDIIWSLLILKSYLLTNRTYSFWPLVLLPYLYYIYQVSNLIRKNFSFLFTPFTYVFLRCLFLIIPHWTSYRISVFNDLSLASLHLRYAMKRSTFGLTVQNMFEIKFAAYVYNNAVSPQLTHIFGWLTFLRPVDRTLPLCVCCEKRLFTTSALFLLSLCCRALTFSFRFR